MDLTDSTLRFNALRCGLITLWRITEANFAHVQALFSGYPDSAYMLGELLDSYRPSYDQDGRQNLYGFYATLEGVLAGGSLLGVSSWTDGRGYTGADTFLHMRGRGWLLAANLICSTWDSACWASTASKPAAWSRTRPPGVRSRRRLAFNSKGL
jgi:hypothetical protein